MIVLKVSMIFLKRSPGGIIDSCVTLFTIP